MIRVAVRGGDKIYGRYQPTIFLKEEQTMSRDYNVIENIMGNYSGLTIRKICTVGDLKYYKILKASKAPVPGEVYDPDRVNWKAVDALLTESAKKKLEKIDWSAYEDGSSIKVEVNYDKFEVGTRWHLRTFGWVTIVYVTNTHVVLILDTDSDIPRSWKLETFITNGPSEVERAEK